MKKAFITGHGGVSHLTDYFMEHTDREIHGLFRWRSPVIVIPGVVA